MILNNKKVDDHYQKLKKEAETSGYNLNPDEEFTKDLIRGLLVNEDRYGYGACPCRLATGRKSEDLDIICPCDYRDQDLSEYGNCFCALYVSASVAIGEQKPRPIPERRTEAIEKKQKTNDSPSSPCSLSLPVWRCRVCGYLCAKKNPPEVCPICKAKQERFERFL